MAISPLYIGCDHTITLTGLTGGGAALTTATVAYAIKDGTGTSIATGSLTHSSGGDYSGTIESSQITTITATGQTYYLELTITQSPYNDFRRIKLTSTYRESE